MKRTILLCAVLLLAALMAWNIQGFAETAAPVPQPEDFAGAYLCTTISFGKDVILPLEGEGPYILRIDGYEALIDGFPELGTEPLPLEYAEGELYFQPPAFVAVVVAVSVPSASRITVMLSGLMPS